jgi:2-hydroxychromene-2-carboxylate isomerase
MTRATWYFDFISPYSYLALPQLERLPAGTQLTYQPVLFAGILKHFGQKGPAEIAAKRIWTYRSCIWLARQQQIPFRMPAAHPFNSLPFLRLSVAAGNSLNAIRTIFETLWTTGCDPADPSVLAALAARVGVTPGRMATDDVKAALRDNTEQAIGAGVFGVPSLVIDGQVFWGSDATDFAAAYLRDPGILESEEMRRADALPVGASRAPQN